MEAIERYPWPGNVRQLLNAIERGKIMADGKIVRLRDLPREVIDQVVLSRAAPVPVADLDDLASIERSKVVEVMRRENGNKTRAARTLGIDRRKLYRLVEKYAIQPAEWGQELPQTNAT